MRERLWILVPAAGVPLLLVLFFVLWQSLQVQNRTIEDLGKRLDELEGLDQPENRTNRQLIQQQLGVLQTRQKSLQQQISDLESWQRSEGARERRIWDRLNTPSILSPPDPADLGAEPEERQPVP
jgi:hypothetical protein